MLVDILKASKGNLPLETTLNFKLLAIILALIAVAPFLRLIFLLGFVTYWLLKNDKTEVYL